MLQNMQRAAYRPFFTLTGLAAICGPLVWWLPVGQPLLVHTNLLLFGMGTAAVAGYLLTALPSWTGHAAIPAWLPGVLIVLWLAGRATALLIESIPWQLAAAPGITFGGLLSGFLLYRIALARAWPRAHLALAPLLPASGEALLMHGDAISRAYPNTTVLGGLIFSLLIVLVGGRAVPAFTTTGLNLRLLPHKIHAPPTLQGLSVAGLVATVLAIMARLPEYWIGTLVMMLGVLQLVRLMGWKPWYAWRVAPLMMLQLSWVWLGLGLMLIGMTLSGHAGLHTGAALHALTVGGMGGMIMAVASRSAMARTAEGLAATAAQKAAIVLVSLAAATRLLPELSGPFNHQQLASLFWIGGWMLFLWALIPALRGPVPRPVLSGPRP